MIIMSLMSWNTGDGDWTVFLQLICIWNPLNRSYLTDLAMKARNLYKPHIFRPAFRLPR
jgi:hypothetical protein